MPNPSAASLRGFTRTRTAYFCDPKIFTCATPLIMAGPLKFYEQQGLNVTLNKTAGWALIRDKMLNKEHDASHFLSPMPLAISMGLGSVAQPMNVATIQNINGQAITLANKHKDKRDPKQWKGLVFAVPFDYSMHNFLLRYYVAEHGLDPDKDIQIRVTPPPEMVANLRAGNIDGYLVDLVESHLVARPRVRRDSAGATR